MVGFFGSPVVESTSGPKVLLTPLGTKLVWAAERLHARLGPSFRTSLKNSRRRSGSWSLVVKPVLRINASHGFAVAKLRDLLLSEEGLGVDIRYVASQSALVSLAQEGCDLAGMHLPSAT